MEGNKVSVIPPLISDFAPLQGNFINEKDSSGRNESPPSDSILKERGRREKTSEKYSVLRSMVPSLSTISKVNFTSLLFSFIFMGVD